MNRQHVIALAAGLPAIAVFVAFGVIEGGHPPTVWYPAAIILLALLAAVLLGTGSVLVPVPLAVATLCLAAFTLWGFATILWADERAVALDGSAKTLLYLAAFALFACLPWRRWSATVALSAFVLATAVVTSAIFLLPNVDDFSSRPFLFGRLADPVGYPNGNAALLLSAFWPAVVLASRRELPGVLRAFLVAAAGGLLELVVATQSRGAAVAALATLLFVVALLPGRVRLLVTLAPVVAVTGIMSSLLIRLGDLSLDDRELREAVADARGGYLLSLGVLFAIGLVLAFGDSWFRRVLPRRSRAFALAVLLALTAAASGVALARIDDVRDVIETSRFSDQQVDGGRLELWRVGLQEFRRHPFIGIGVDNFAVPYTRERRSDDEEPIYPHSLLVRIPSQTGIVGTLLFAGFLTGAALAAFRAARPDSATAAVVLAATLPAVGWAIQGSLDWFWELPALAAPAFAFLALAGRVAVADSPGMVLRGRALQVVAGACVVAMVLLLPLWLSARNVEIAGREWSRDPARALSRLDLAARLNPLSDTPAVTAGAIASRRRDFRSMAAFYAESLERNPYSWYAHLQLAVADSQTGRQRAALQSIRRARELNPLEPVLVNVERQLEQGRRPDPRALDRYFIEQAGDLIR